MKIQFSWVTLRAIIYIAALLTIAEIVRPRFIVRPENARQSAARAQIATFNAALRLYKLEHGNYPKSLDELIVNKSGKNFLNDVQQVPTDPWGNPFRYSFPATNGHEYEVVSFGADGKPGGSYDNADIMSWNISSSYKTISF